MGFQSFRDDIGNYSIPVILAEYGCLNPSFPTLDGYDAQRTFLQSEWIYEPEFYDILQGGFVFEFSVEVRLLILLCWSNFLYSSSSNPSFF
jgi:hypothetical protein